MTRRHRQLLVASATAATLAAATTLATASTSTAAPPGTTALAACTGTWQPTTTPGLPKNFIPYDIKVFNSKKTMMVGMIGDPFDQNTTASVATWNGTRWTTTNLGNGYASDIAATTGSNAFALVNDEVQQFNGKTWKKLPTLSKILGEWGWVNAMATNATGDVWVVGTTDAGGVRTPVLAHYFGGAWKVVPNNLANSAYAVPLDLKFSPTGELWTVGEDVPQDPVIPIVRKPFAGKVVGGQMKRVELPEVPGQTSTMPTSLTWDAKGKMVVDGWTGEDWAYRAYPFSATPNTDGSWKVISRPAVHTGWTTPRRVERIGSKVWSLDSGMLNDTFNEGMSTLENAGWSQPRYQAAPSRKFSLFGGARDGSGLMVTGDDSSGVMTYKSLCGTPPAVPGVPGTTATVTPPAMGARATALPKAAKLSAAERKRAAAMRSGTALDGLKVVRAAKQDTPLSGPVIDRLREKSRTAAPTTYVAKDACGTAKATAVRCYAKVVSTKSSGSATARAAVTSVPFGYGAAEYRKAYGLPASGGKGRTVAVVAAYGYPTLEADLAQYRKASGLPACTVASGCLTVTGQDGGAPPAAGDIGWEIEQAMDIQTVSAICPDCKILVVQATSPEGVDITAANKQAAAKKPWVINNSFGRLESSVDKQLAQDEIPKDVPIVASSGDDGLQLSYPATVPSVIGVGGTRLLPAPGTARGWREDLWSLSGGGCSTVQPKPAYQKQNICRDGRSSTVSLVANADPATGSGVYYGGEIDGQSGVWLVIGGTSLSAPITAASFALRGIKPSNAALWSGAVTAKPITTKFTNGWCAPVAECTSGRAFNGATGFGYLAGK